MGKFWTNFGWGSGNEEGAVTEEMGAITSRATCWQDSNDLSRPWDPFINLRHPRQITDSLIPIIQLDGRLFGVAIGTPRVNEDIFTERVEELRRILGNFGTPFLDFFSISPAVWRFIEHQVHLQTSTPISRDDNTLQPSCNTFHYYQNTAS